jgi:hypothetical protein
MLDDRDRYRPRGFEEPVSIINEPVRETIELQPGAKQRTTHAVIAKALASAEALIARLEFGVRTPDNQRALSVSST